MAKYNTSEIRALQRGGTILKEATNKATGEDYTVEVKRSWDRMYYQVEGCGWYRTPKEARLAAESVSVEVDC